MLDTLIPLIVALALFLFFWGLVKFIWNSGDESSIKQGRDLMIWGVVVLFVMVSVFGILSLLSNSFGINFDVPQIESKLLENNMQV